MSKAFAMGLGHLVRPEHMLNPKLRFTEQQQQHYFQGCSSLWEIILTNPRESVRFQVAYRKLVALPVFLMAKMGALQAPSNRERKPSQSPIQLLIQQVSSARPIPSWADFEAGISAFHERGQSSMSDVSMLEVPFGSLSIRDQSIGENVAVALTFLDCDINSTTADEIKSVWDLLGLQGGAPGELEEYLRLACP